MENLEFEQKLESLLVLIMENRYYNRRNRDGVQWRIAMGVGDTEAEDLNKYFSF